MRDIKTIANDKSASVTFIVHDALKLYRDKCFMETQATFLPQEILQAMQASVNLLESRINNRSNQLLSSLAIQQFIFARAIADSLELSPDALEAYRVQAVEFLKSNNRVLTLKELVE